MRAVILSISLIYFTAALPCKTDEDKPNWEEYDPLRLEEPRTHCNQHSPTAEPCQPVEDGATPCEAQMELQVDPTLTSFYDERCKDGWMRYQQSCYYIERSSPASLKEAEAKCVEKEASLFVANNEDEFKAVFAEAPHTTFSWVGAYKKDDKSEPVWHTAGMDVRKLKWLADPYTDAGNGWSTLAQCAGLWNPTIESAKYIFWYPCDYKFNYVCERSAAVLASDVKKHF